MCKRLRNGDTDLVYDSRRWNVGDVPSHPFINRVRLLSLTRKERLIVPLKGVVSHDTVHLQGIQSENRRKDVALR